MLIDEATTQRVEKILEGKISRTKSIQGGYTLANRFIVELKNGQRFFIKQATDNDTAAWLRSEHLIYSNLHENYLPRLIAWEDSQAYPILILEDLSEAEWKYVWDSEKIKSVLFTLEKVRKTIPPQGLPSLESQRNNFAGWKILAQDPQPFLSLGLASSKWLQAALPILIDADETAPLAGNELVHVDIRSDNICFQDNRAILIDWNWACLGNGAFDIVGWLPSLYTEGGKPPDIKIEDAGKLSALVSGFWAARAGLPPPHPGSNLREVQKNQLAISLAWTIKELGLPAIN